MSFWKKEALPGIMLAFSCIILLANVVIRIIGLPETATIYYFDIATVTLALIALAISLMAFSHSPAGSLKRKFWLIESAYFLFLMLGEASWGFYEIVLKIETPIVSMADFFWMASYGIQIAAVILISRNVFVKRRYYYYAIGTALLSFTAFYCLFFKEVIASGEIYFLEQAVSIGYPLLDIICAAIIVPVFITSIGGGKIFNFAKYISMGFLCFAVFDSLFYYLTWKEMYSTGDSLDIVYDAAYVFFAFAAYYGYKHLLGVKSIAKKECDKCQKN